MYRISCTAIGTAKLLFNRVLDGELEADPSKPRKNKSRMTPQERDEEAAERVYRNKQGIYMPAWNFKQCVLRGAQLSGLKVGKTGLKEILAPSFFPDDELLFGKKEPDELFVHWGRRPPRTGAAVMVRRPACNKGWKLKINAVVWDDSIASGDVREAIEVSGARVGLGSWRPEHGRFIIQDWKIEKEK